MGNNQDNSSNSLLSWVDWLLGANINPPPAASGETRHEAESTSTETTSSLPKQTQHSQAYKDYVDKTSKENSKDWSMAGKFTCGGKEGTTARDERNDKLPETEAYVSRETLNGVKFLRAGENNASAAWGLEDRDPVPDGCFEKIQVPSSISGHRPNFGASSEYDFTSSSYTSGLTGSGSSALFSASGSNRDFPSYNPPTAQQEFSDAFMSVYNRK
jgi:hypothetical protein